MSVQFVHLDRIGGCEITDQRRARIVDENVDGRIGAEAPENQIELGAVNQVGRDDFDRNAKRVA